MLPGKYYFSGDTTDIFTLRKPFDGRNYCFDRSVRLTTGGVTPRNMDTDENS